MELRTTKQHLLRYQVPGAWHGTRLLPHREEALRSTLPAPCRSAPSWQSLLFLIMTGFGVYSPTELTDADRKLSSTL